MKLFTALSTNSFYKRLLLLPLCWTMACGSGSTSYQEEEDPPALSLGEGVEDLSSFYNGAYADTLYNTDPTAYDSTNDGSINVPYNQKGNDLITLPIKVNNVGFEMIFDTGASTTCITLAEAQYMFQKGSLTSDDLLEDGPALFQTADGSISVGLRVNLREVKIGDQITLYNVEALVVDNMDAPLLLGQSVFKKFKEISVDMKNKWIKFFKE
ncbi:retropepsin-like aspartic protease family protein [Capnocytophaga granulosa]|jgi:tetratricopeptide repeat family protein